MATKQAARRPAGRGGAVVFPINFAKLARDSGVSPSVITYFLGGERDVGYTTALTVAETLGVRLEALRELIGDGRVRGLEHYMDVGVNDEGKGETEEMKGVRLEWEKVKGRQDC